MKLPLTILAVDAVVWIWIYFLWIGPQGAEANTTAVFVAIILIVGLPIVLWRANHVR